MRLTDDRYTPKEDVIPALKVILNVLLGQGITNHAKEVQALALDALLKITTVAKVISYH